MRCFNKFISDSNLIDPPLSNAKFTWSNLRVQPVLSRIDRFLYTANWENLFTAHYSKTLSRVTSDHFPIALESSMISWGPSPFKFINVHLKEPWFKKNVTIWWKNLRQGGHPGFSFMKKLKQLSAIIRDEQKKNKCYNDEEKKAWIKEIDNIDRLEAEGNFSEELSLRRTKLKADVLMSGFKEAQIWYQKSKRLWITEGDENTSFFHKICSARQRRSIISNINSVDGVPCSTNESIAKAFLDHFEDIYKGGGEESPWLIDNLSWSPISTTQAQNLCSLFTEEEIHAALTAFSNNKSPGPDGFTMEFYKSTWSVLKEEIFNIFRDFHSNCIINKAVNMTNIALIAKKRMAENQMTFVKGRQIIDAILVANEAIDYWRVKKIQGFVIKLDIEKAFDKLNWRFIDFMLMKKGYPFRWRKWIRACISSVQYSIIINGRPRGKIQPSRGIRQGDPISPFIFVLAMDYISRLLNSVGEKIKGVKMEGNINLTHLLFADDILLFVEDDEHSIQNLKNIINLFQLASGLSINLNKSTISPINVGAARTEQIASQWGISTKFLPINYLGVPLGGKQTTKSFWKNVEEKINKKLTSWKYSMLSKGAADPHGSPYAKDWTGFKDMFPGKSKMDSSIRDMWNNTLMDWDLNPRRQIRDWEYPLWAELKNSLNVSFCENGKDSPTWALNSDGFYTVASVKKALQQPDQSFLDLQSQNTFKNLWKTSIPKKCIFFIWTLLYDSVNTAEQLTKRMPNLCSRPSCWKQKTKKNVILYNTYASALWNIWLERNARIFNGKEKTVAEIWEDIKALAGLWTSRSSLFTNYQASSIALNLNAFS
ncbi:LINE-1 retrotransposable element ORF2 protein [Cucumis melo var. makuwa]|uniref:LINE-1 retrotransposable element ORF2 protein n=1 Tax=Cucumis melo var. makuwa TaxID=1194695 RepID=A0A5A7TCY9_CUCMM|nr:LINE-1 retrotransposable element ORF2 protein [Cucumis melo var. makuwa]